MYACVSMFGVRSTELTLMVSGAPYSSTVVCVPSWSWQDEGSEACSKGMHHAMESCRVRVARPAESNACERTYYSMRKL